MLSPSGMNANQKLCFYCTFLLCSVYYPNRDIVIHSFWLFFNLLNESTENYFTVDIWKMMMATVLKKMDNKKVELFHNFCCWINIDWVSIRYNELRISLKWISTFSCFRWNWIYLLIIIIPNNYCYLVIKKSISTISD